MTTPSAFKRDGLLSSGDIAKKLGVHRTTVWHWMQSGMLGFVQVTPRFRGVKPSALKLFEANFVGSAAVSSATTAPSKKKAAKKATKKKPKRKRDGS